MSTIKNPLISVIMSCYHSDKEYLKQAIESILNQTYTNFEFLIANNGEEFDLEEFLKQFKDSRIKYIDNKTNIGPAKSFNNLETIAKGKYIALQDHDDISLPNRLQIQQDELDNNPILQSVSCLIHIFGTREYDDGIAMEPEQVKEELIFWQPIKQPTYMKRKEFCNLYKQNPNWFIGDYEFWSRTRKQPHKIINSRQLNYRKVASNSGPERANNVRREHALLVQRNLKWLNIEAPIELCQMLDPFCHKKFSKKYVDLFKSYKDILLNEISESLYNRKLKEISDKVK